MQESDEGLDQSSRKIRVSRENLERFERETREAERKYEELMESIDYELKEIENKRQQILEIRVKLRDHYDQVQHTKEKAHATLTEEWEKSLREAYPTVYKSGR